MSFWSYLGKTAKTVAQSATPVGFAWALAENWDAGGEESTNVFSKFFASEKQMAQQNLGGIGYSVQAPYSTLVSRPISTAVQAGQTWDTVTSGDAWSQAWKNSENVSPGQAISISAINWWDQEQRYSFDAAGAEDREQLFHHQWGGRIASGTMDLVLNLSLDPLAIGGKSARAAEVGATTVEAKNVGSALDVATGAKGAEQVTRQQAVAGSRISSLFQRTDGMTFEQMMNLPEFRSTTDSAVLATMFADANKITDKAARWEAKRDIFGAALGDNAAITKLSTSRADLAEKMKRFVSPVENSNGHLAFAFDDYGQGEIKFFNDPAKLQEIMADQEKIEAELARLERLTAIQGQTDKIGQTIGDRLGRGVRTARLEESLIYKGPGSRPIRVVHAAVGTHVPGYIDTKNVDDGFDQLSQALGRSAFLTREQRLKYLQEFAKADSREARNEVVWRAENAIYTAAGKANGYSYAEIRALYQSTTGVRRTAINSLRTRLYSAAPDSALQKFVVGIDDEGTAHAISVPFLQSHHANTVPLTDPKALESVIKADQNTRWLERLAQRWEFGQDAATRITNAGVKGADIFDDLAYSAMKWWKASALLRIAYPIRIQVDTQLRNLAALGPMTYALTAKAGAVNAYRNRAGVLAAVPGGRVENPDLVPATRDLTSQINALVKKIRASKDQAVKDRLTKKLEKLEAQIEDIPLRVRLGQTEQKASILKTPQTYKGVEIQPGYDDNAFAVAVRQLDSNGTTALIMSDGTAEAAQSLRSTGGWESVSGGQPNWIAAYLRAVNQQIRNSPTARKILETRNDADVASFVRDNPEARAEWKMVRNSFESPEDWILYARQQIDHLVNDNVSAILRTRQITKAEVEAEFAEVAKRPDVHGEAYSFRRNSPLADTLQSWAEKWYRFASDGPENVMGRHPLYNARFRDHMKAQIDRTEGAIGEADIARMRKSADALARRDVANTLYDLTKRSNASDSFRHFSPFFAAWEDTMLKWGRLFYDNPARAVRFAQGWRAPNEAGLVVDDQGNPVHDGKTWDPVTGKPITDKAYIGKGEYVILPKWAAPGSSGGTLRLRKDSFNIVFQGEPWWLPGGGPLVQIPTNEIVKRAFPESTSNPVVAAVLPFGTDNRSIVDQALPTWVTRARTAFSATTAQGAGSDDYAKVYAMFTAQAWADYNEDQGKGKPDAKKIANQTRNWFILRAVLAQASPVSAQPQPRLQFYIDQAHQYQRKYGMGERDSAGNQLKPSWQQKYYNDFPEYFEMALSLSTNETGIQASVQAYDATKKYRRFIAQNPELGWMFVGADNVYAFDQGIYNWQKGTAIGFGQTKTFRGLASPAESIAKIRAEKGWIEYNKAMTWINLQLEQRGLHSLSQKGAEDLAGAKREYIRQLGAENRDWNTAYNTSDDGRVQRLAQAALDAMRQSKALSGRSDMQALLQYLSGRDWIRGQLAARKAAGGSGALSSEENSDLEGAWNAYKAQLTSSDIGFEQMYNRVLLYDDMTRDLNVQ